MPSVRSPTTQGSTTFQDSGERYQSAAAPSAQGLPALLRGTALLQGDIVHVDALHLVSPNHEVRAAAGCELVLNVLPPTWGAAVLRPALAAIRADLEVVRVGS